MKHLFFFACLIFAVCGQAQQNGTLKGRVTDENINNEPVAFANVAIYKMPTDKNAELIIVDGTSTDENGEYVISNIPEGNYVVEVTYIDFPAPLVLKNVKIKANTVASLDIAYPKLMEERKNVSLLPLVNYAERSIINVTETSNTTTIKADDIRRMGIR